MQAIIFALISFVGWGTGTLLEAVVIRKLNTYSFIICSYILSLFILSFYAPFVLGELKNLTFNLLMLTLLISFIALFLGTLFYFEALRIGNRVLVGTIAAAYPLVAVVLSVVFLGDRVSLQQTIAIIITFAGLFLSAIDLRMLKSKFLFNKASLLALMPMFTWGIYLAFIKIPIREIGWFWPNYIYFLFFPIIFLFLKLKKLKLEIPRAKNILILVIFSTILVRIAELSYNFAISKGLVTIVAPIAGSYPALFVILAFLFFKDPITKQQIIGIITTLIGIVLLSIFSV